MNSAANPPQGPRRDSAERNLRIALFLRQVRWINLILVGAVLFAGIVAIGAVSLTAPPKGTTSDVMPFIVVAAVGQLGAFLCMYYGIAVLRDFTRDGAGAPSPDAAEFAAVVAHWRLRLRRVRMPMLAVGFVAGAVTLLFTGFTVITITGTALGLAFILQLVILFSVVTKSRGGEE